MRQSKVYSACINGTNIQKVIVEVDITRGIPGISIVGMPDTAIYEARSRIRSAIQACGYTMPRGHIVINLAPSHIRKHGSGFDLAIALGILLASEQIIIPDIESYLIVGELSLSGQVRPVQGMLAYELFSKEERMTLLSGAKEGEALSVKGCDRRVLRWLSDIESPLCALSIRLSKAKRTEKNFNEVYGQDFAKRALCIAAAGRHSALMLGSAGAGKTMLAERFSSILPKLSEKGALESARIHSIKGLEFESILEGERPFRSPHHSISKAALIGGGYPIRAGEVSLAHNGVLFMDELSEFSHDTLQLLRQALDSGTISLSRSKEQVVLPAKFLLLAASNPCDCGNLYEQDKACTCTDNQLKRYAAKLKGPLIDRIDIVFHIKRASSHKLIAETKSQSSEELKSQVFKARSFKKWREEKEDVTCAHTERDRALLSCKFDRSAQKLLEKLAEQSALSARSLIKVLKVSRTIADLDEESSVKPDHLLEAFNYKVV